MKRFRTGLNSGNSDDSLFAKTWKPAVPLKPRRRLDLAIAGKTATISPTTLVWQHTNMPSEISKKNSDLKKINDDLTSIYRAVTRLGQRITLK